MLKIEYYKKIDELYSLSFIDNSYTNIMICPSPVITDSVRTKVPDNIEVITISKFLQNKLEKISKEKEKKILVRKSDLLIELGNVWNKVFKDYPPEIFGHAFKLLTELRGHTLQIELIEEIFPEFDSDVVNVLKTFWQYLNQVERQDEHKVYDLLSDLYRSGEYFDDFDKERNNLIFIGFTHLSAVQVDFLKTIGLRHNIYIPVPCSIKSKIRNSDWIHWIDSTKYEGKEALKREVNTISFTKNRMSSTISNLLNSSNDNYTFVIGDSNLSQNNISEIPQSDLNFKTPVDIFSEVVKQVFSEIREEVLYVRKYKLATGLTKLLEGKIIDHLKSKQSPRYLKVVMLIVEALNKWSEYNEEDFEINTFELNILEEVVQLNLPRVYFTPVTNGVSNRIVGINQLDDCDNDEQIIICASSSYTNLLSTKSVHSEKVLSFLSTIGPVRRSELDFLFLRDKVEEKLSLKNTILLIEDGLTEFDLSWAEILEDFSLVEKEINEGSLTAKRKDEVSNFVTNEFYNLKKVSATKLQTYIDCPRKFYFQYVSPVVVQKKSQISIEPYLLGQIEHKIIEKYIESNTEWNEEKHIVLTKGILKQTIDKNKLLISDNRFKTYLIEAMNYSRAGIEYLFGLRNILGDIDFLFEVDIKDQNHQGSIDCIIKGDFGVGIIDFKRSIAGIPSAREVLTYSKIQLLYYLTHFQQDPLKYKFFGYVNLSEISKSRLFSTVPEIEYDDPGNISELIEGYKNKEKNLIEVIKSDKNFYPVPKNKTVCKFCIVSKVCTRNKEQE
ncbi:MAG: hypothetical protein HOJ35_07640 [Bdellovibrionales bacterium]|nr:hypothetical protein [Bdellovibrionales bacterium]